MANWSSLAWRGADWRAYLGLRACLSVCGRWNCAQWPRGRAAARQPMAPRCGSAPAGGLSNTRALPLACERHILPPTPRASHLATGAAVAAAAVAAVPAGGRRIWRAQRSIAAPRAARDVRGGLPPCGCPCTPLVRPWPRPHPWCLRMRARGAQRQQHAQAPHQTEGRRNSAPRAHAHMRGRARAAARGGRRRPDRRDHTPAREARGDPTSRARLPHPVAAAGRRRAPRRPAARARAAAAACHHSWARARARAQARARPHPFPSSRAPARTAPPTSPLTLAGRQGDCPGRGGCGVWGATNPPPPAPPSHARPPCALPRAHYTNTRAHPHVNSHVPRKCKTGKCMHLSPHYTT